MGFDLLFQTSADGILPWWRALLDGLGWTVAIAAGAGIIAFFLGSAVGVLRTVPVRWVQVCAATYVELFRSIPLLVQAFLWYYVLPELCPPVKGWAVSTEPRYVAFTMAVLCLGTYSASRVAEQVRAGIEARSAGLIRAAQALGLSPWHTYRYVVLPVVYRIILPPLTSEAMSIVKNSSVAYSIGMAELFFQTLKMGESTFRYFESFVFGALGYMVVGLSILLVMRWLERRYHLVGTLGDRAA